MIEENMKHRIKSAVISVLYWLCWVSGSTALATPAVGLKADDPHYSDAGFFDIHVCNWPNCPQFYKPLFSTTRFDDIKEIEVLYPDGRLLSKMDLARYRLVDKSGKPLKKVFLADEIVPVSAPSDWYSARITMKDGKNIPRAISFLSKPCPSPPTSIRQPTPKTFPCPWIFSF